MPFTVMEFLTRVLASLGVEVGLVGTIMSKLAELRTAYPDLATQIDKLTAFLTEILTPYLDVVKLKGTIYGIAQDLVTGTTGVDPDAWTTSV